MCVCVCGTCPFLQTGLKTVYILTLINVNSTMNCKSKNLIYYLTCPTCGDNYIGQTGTKLADRVRVQKQQIRDPCLRNTPFSCHFDTCGNGMFFIK